MRRVLISLVLAPALALSVVAVPTAGAEVSRSALLNRDPLRPSSDPVELVNAQRPLDVTYDHGGQTRTLPDYLERAAQGFVVLDGNKIVNEWYAPGRSPSTLFQTWSIAKAFTAHAIGIAHTEGAIRSLDDTVGAYVPELADRPFGAVTIRNLLHMTSGIKWNSSVDDYWLQLLAGTGLVSTLQYAARQSGDVPQGSAYNYNSLNSAVLALVLERATRRPYHQYVQDKIWGPAGMAAGAFVGNDLHGNALGYCCYHAQNRDLARYGLLMLNGGRANGRQVLPTSWLDYASIPTPVQPDHNIVSVLDGTEGYWNGGFGGQMLYMSTKHRVVIVKTTLFSTVDEAETLTVMRAVAAEVAATR
ncbi:serine hydrolase domain-containing protein [Thermomonospora umbrina]|uniref:CubicO group peptidase (Beta-lactamase class C family) n=1 Tax=Thermomonospora umbrina TaxID=111806 RepID=A0A3D9T2D3_9ACTN|nr:serine hydrolase [Thermomonospora umbrina]REE97991.1 CubicO group peptidase (beta-lactamase class C family) [Thermomonospora umbrina]